MTLPNLSAALAAPWAVSPTSVPALRAMLRSGQLPEADLKAALEDMPRVGVAPRAGRGVAVLPVRGFLLNRCTALEEWFGLASCERIGAWLDAFLADEGVSAIVLQCDSPGGSVLGIEELARKILAGRDVKPIVAVVDPMACSAAYWLAAAASEVVVTASSLSANVGILMLREDTTAADADAGIVTHVFSAGEFKAEGLPCLPMTDEEREAGDALCGQFYGLFTATVAKGRGVTAAAVRSGFGQGRPVTGADAVKLGVADRIGTYEAVLAKLTKRKGAMAALPLFEGEGTDVAPAQVAAAAMPFERYLAGVVERMQATNAMRAGGDGTVRPVVVPSPAPAPQAKEIAMTAPVTPAPTPGAEQEEMSRLRAEAARAQGLRALVKNYPEYAAKLPAWLDGNITPQAASDEIIADLRKARTAAPAVTVGGLSPTGAEPNEAKRPWGGPEYQALRARVDSGALKASDPRFVQARNTALGEQLQAIANFRPNGAGNDPRLFAAVSGASANVGGDGAFMIQKEFTTDLMASTFEGGEILSRVDSHEVGANADGLEVAYLDETSRATGSRWGGVQVYRGAEADSATAKKPKIGKWEVRLEDIIGAAYMTERLLQDAPSMAAVFSAGFAAEFQFQVEDEIFRGNGAGQCLGYTAAAGPVVEVAKESAQTAATIVYANVKKMWARVHPRSKANGVWFINTACITQLMDMQVGVGTAGALVFMPPGGISGLPYATLFGRPVIEIEYASALGTAGDISFADLSRYKVITKGGLQADDSIHVRFLNNERTFRWLTRVNGAPKDKSAITPYKGTDTLSPFITLATRA